MSVSVERTTLLTTYTFQIGVRSIEEEQMFPHVTRKCWSPDIPIPNAFIYIKKNQLQFYPLKERLPTSCLSLHTCKLETTLTSVETLHSLLPKHPKGWGYKQPKKDSKIHPQNKLQKNHSAYMFSCQSLVFDWSCLTCLHVAHTVFMPECGFIRNRNVSLMWAGDEKLEAA